MEMRRFIIPGTIAAAAVLVLVLLTYGVSHQTLTSSIDAQVAHRHYPPAPDQAVRLPLLGSTGKMSLAGLRGKVVVLNVFASWCEPCQSEAPLLARYQKTLARHGDTFVGVTYLDDPISSAQFDRRYGITYPVLQDAGGNFVRSYGTAGVPETFVINRSGHIEALSRGPIDQAWLSANVTPLLGPS